MDQKWFATLFQTKILKIGILLQTKSQKIWTPCYCHAFDYSLTMSSTYLKLDWEYSVLTGNNQPCFSQTEVKCTIFQRQRGFFIPCFRVRGKKHTLLSGQRVGLQIVVFQCHLSYTQEYNYQSSEKRGVGVKAKIINYYYFHWTRFLGVPKHVGIK